jgi:transcriptional regulator with XRE-family HTH domain
MAARPAKPENLSNVQSNVIYECMQIRERAGVSQRDLARRMGLKSHMPINRWEKGRWGTARGPGPDEIIAAYAELTKKDSGAIWRSAVRSWHTPVPGSPKSQLAGLASEAEHLLRRRKAGAG